MQPGGTGDDRIDVAFDGSFDGWRPLARQAVLAGVSPARVCWVPPDAAQSSLFGSSRELPPPAAGATLRVPRRYVDQARRAACHSDERRWDLLYRILWRVSRGAHDLLDDAPDRDISKLRKLDAEVRRDCHKMKAFVRFRRLDDAGGETWIAWHQPDHPIGRLVAPFFRDRFAPMRWSILMPNESLHWDTHRLRFGPGAQRSDAPAHDELETLWRDYYRAIFNPARVKVSAMKAEMPMKHWSTLPEAQDIADLLREAPARVAEMVKHEHSDASAWLPEQRDVTSLALAMRRCEACPRMCAAEPGDAPDGSGAHPWSHLVRAGVARVICVAEEPTADGSAERVFDRVRDELVKAGVRPSDVALTFAVKKAQTTRGDAKELAKHITACRPWLLAELEASPQAHVIAMGPLAARSVLGRHVAPADAAGQRWEGFGMRAVWVIDGVRELNREADTTAGTRWARSLATLRELAATGAGNAALSASCETSR